MTSPSFKLDRQGVREILRTQFADVINAAAESVASQVRSTIQANGDDAEVTVTPYLRDRQAATVTIADPDGLRIQASSGALTRAAIAVGLEVRPK